MLGCPARSPSPSRRGERLRLLRVHQAVETAGPQGAWVTLTVMVAVDLVSR